MKINKAVFRYIEHELYNYNETKKEINEMKEDIAEELPGPSDGQPKALNKISDTTFNKTSKIMTNKYICRANRTINAIDEAVSLMDEGLRKIYDLKYQKKWDYRTICENPETRMDDSTFRRKRGKIIELVAMEMGLIY